MRIKHIVLSGVLLIIGLVFYLFTQQPLALSDYSIELEFGEKTSSLTMKNIELNPSKSILVLEIDESVFTFRGVNEYPEIGSYDVPVEFRYRNRTHNDILTVHVIDSVAPSVVIDQETIQWRQGTTLDESKILLNFGISDLSAFDQTLDLSNVDINRPGVYVATLTVKDVFENEASHLFSVEIIKQELGVRPTYINGILLVNKRHPLPHDFDPGENAEAGAAIRDLITEMRALGFDIDTSFSGYRTYQRQAELYNNYVQTHGKQEADTFSARPGFSEHQSGLAFDLRHRSGMLVEALAESTWIAQNAHRYGFIVRYPKGKESITGYEYEPWHLRFVGNAATKIFNNGITLEEYLNAPGGDYLGD